MGVVYKLKKEIVDFVLQQKKDNNKISCRSLSEIVQKKFQVNVSKSSINQILKEAQLSSPVGRRSSSPKKAIKFKIPSDKINTLFPSPLVDNEIIKKIKKDSPSQKSDGFIIYDSLGAVFIKLALLEMNGYEIFSKLVAFIENCPDALKKAEIWEYLLIKQFSGNLEENNNFFEKMKWFLEGTNQNIQKEIVEQAVNADLKVRKDFFINVSEYFCEVSYLKMILEKGDEVWIDSEMISVWTKPVERTTTAFLVNYLSNIVNAYVLNVQTVVLCNFLINTNLKMNKYSIFSKEFKDFVGAFENIPGHHIEKMIIYDENLKELAVFDSLPNVKRSFITAIWPWQLDFSFLLKYEKIRKKEEFFVKGLPKILFWEEDISVLPNEDFQKLGNLRMFLLREIQAKDPFVIIISNIEENKANAYQIISEYFLRWPNFQEGYGYNLARNSEELLKPPSLINIQEMWGKAGKDITVIGFLKYLEECLRRHLQETYFPSRNEAFVNDLLTTAGVSGYFIEEDVSKIILFVSGKDNLFQGIQLAAKRVNERNIRNGSGKKMVLEVREKNNIKRTD